MQFLDAPWFSSLVVQQCSVVKLAVGSFKNLRGPLLIGLSFPLLISFLYLQNLGGGMTPGPPDGYGPLAVKLAVMMMMITMTVAHFIDE